MARSHGDRGDGPDNKFRALKKEIETLKQEKAQLRKEYNKAMQFVAEAKNALNAKGIKHSEKEVNPKETLTCTDCGKGTYDVFAIKIGGENKTYHTCNLCGHRKVEIVKE